MMWRSQYLSAFSVATGVLTACAHQSPGSDAGNAASRAPIRVVAIERVYGNIASQLAAGGVDVVTILNSPSADPHAYEPTTRDADAIASADVVVENGLGYDAFADKLIAASPKANRTVIVVGMLAGHHVGDNPHVWYETATLRRFTDVFATEIGSRFARQPGRSVVQPLERDRARASVFAWIDRLSARESAIAKRHPGARVAITEPVFDYVLSAAHLTIATPTSFSHAIEEGNDPAPQDVDTMRALLAGRNVGVFVYNKQTVEPSTERLLAVAQTAGVHVVPVTETLPDGQTTQTWIDGEVRALERAL